MCTNESNSKRQINLCTACGSTLKKIWAAKGFQIGRCKQCGFAQVLDVPSADKLSQIYETLHIKHIKYRSKISAQLENRRRLEYMENFKYIFTHIVPREIINYETRGKIVDLAFSLYKVNQMSKWLAPEWLLGWVGKKRLGRIRLYIPSNDIAYLTIRKPLINE